MSRPCLHSIHMRHLVKTYNGVSGLLPQLLTLSSLSQWWFLNYPYSSCYSIYIYVSHKYIKEPKDHYSRWRAEKQNKTTTKQYTALFEETFISLYILSTWSSWKEDNFSLFFMTNTVPFFLSHIKSKLHHFTFIGLLGLVQFRWSSPMLLSCTYTKLRHWIPDEVR